MIAKSWSTEGLKITDKLVDGVKIKVYADRPHSLREVLRNAVDKYLDKVAFIYQDEPLT
jgi:hypothetical protein